MGCVVSKERRHLRGTVLKIEADKRKVKPHPDRRNTVIELDDNKSESLRSRRVLQDALESKDSMDCGHVAVSLVTSDVCKIETVYDGVHDGPILGYGIGGLVRLVEHKQTGTKYAVKTLGLDQIQSKEGLKQVREEVEILMMLDHPNIVKLDGVYEANNEIYLVQELCHGGDLFDRLDAQPNEHYSEAQCARLVKQMLSAVRYIHSKGIIHRDLKLENFLFDHSGSNAELKMIDFGLSKHFKIGDIHHEPVGTRYTVAPEVLKGNYDEKVDIWAIGVITFLLLSGVSPFGGCGEGTTNMEVRSNILDAKFTFQPKEYWSHVSESAKDFISMLLVVDPQKRPTAEQCQNSEWVREWSIPHNGEDAENALNSNVVKAIRKFRKFSDMRKLLCEVIGFTLLPEQISELRKEFEKLDVEQSGEISLGNLKQVLMKNAGDGGLLNTITEEEVEDIFNSLRLHKYDTTIHWHHFLAAGLSELPVDERNHKLAFDRLDTEQKGYITFDDVIELIGAESLKRRKQSIQGEWNNSVENCRCGSRIFFKDFVRIVQLGDDQQVAA